MDYQYAPPPPPPPAPRRFRIERVHHFNDAYFPYNRDYVEKKHKIGLLAGMSLTSLGAGIIGGHLMGVGALLWPTALGVVGLGVASVIAIKAALSKKVAPPPPPEEVVYEDVGYGYRR